MRPRARPCRRLNSSASPSESASLSDSFFPGPQTAGVRPAAGRLRHSLIAALLCLPLLAILATGATAQTPTANPDGSYTVPDNWALKPSGVGAGRKFRLLFITDDWHNASSSSISTYDTHVRGEAASGHSLIRPYASQFKAVGSTASVDARNHVGATGTGVPIYWLNGAKVADNYGDFWDGSWDAYVGSDRRNELGQANNPGTQSDWPWTGSNNNGTKSIHPLGSADPTRGAHPPKSPISGGSRVSNTQTHAFYALSPVFVVEGEPPPPSLTLPASSTLSVVALSRKDAESPSTSSGKFRVHQSASQPKATPYRMCFTSSLATPSFTVKRGSTTVSLDAQGCTTGSIPANQSAFIPSSFFEVAGTEDTLDEPDEVITATISAHPTDALPNGVAISSTADTATVTIRDDDPTVVRLARVGSGAISEGQTVEFRVTLSRALIAGEVVDVPLAISGTGVTTDDWSLTTKTGTNLNTGVRLSGTTATPMVRFAHSFQAGAQVATLILRATEDNTAEGGSETLTVALGPNGSGTNGFDRSSRRTNVGGGADPSGTASERTFNVTVNDATVTVQPTLTLSVDGGAGSIASDGKPYIFEWHSGHNRTVRVTGTNLVSGQSYCFGVPQITITNGYTHTVRQGGAAGCITGSTNGTADHAYVNFYIPDDQKALGDGAITVALTAGSGGNTWTNGTPDGVTLRVIDNDALMSWKHGKATVVEGETFSLPFVLDRPSVGNFRVTHQFSTQDTRFKISPGNKVDDDTDILDYFGPDDSHHVGRDETGGGIGPFMTFDDDVVERDYVVTSTLRRAGAALVVAVDQNRNTLDITVKDDDKATVSLRRRGSGNNLVLWFSRPMEFPVEIQVWGSQSPPSLRTYTLPANSKGFLGGGGVELNTPNLNDIGYVWLLVPNDVNRTDDWLWARNGCIVASFRSADFAPDGAGDVPCTDTDLRDISTEFTPGVTDRGGSPPVVAPREPEVSIALAAGSGTEGGDVEYVISARPAPLTPLRVTVTVSQSGAFVAAGDLGRRTVTIPAGGQATVTVATVDDRVEEADGSVTLTVEPGSGYRVGQPAAMTADVADDDGVVRAQQQASADPAAVKMVEDMIVRHRDVTGNKGALANWEKALKTLKGQPGGFTIEELEARVAQARGAAKKRWQRVLDGAKAMQAGGGTGGTPGTPAITVTPGSAVTEGTAASFTLTADPAPKAELAVTVTVEQMGGYVASRNRGKRTVTISAGAASAGFTVATKGDKKDKPDGAVTAMLEAGTGYAVGESATATVPVRDDDAMGVTLSAEAGDLAEGAGRKLVRLTLGRKLVVPEALTVTLTFGGTATVGTDYTLSPKGASRPGVRYANLASADPAKPPTVTFTGPSAKSAKLVLAASADGANEGDGETVTVALGTLTPTDLGGGADGAGAVAFTILEPPPEISIAAKTASITEGAKATFTVTASRAPEADLPVTLTVAEADGSDMVAADSEGTATVTIAKGQTEAALTVPTVNDTQDEPDGTVTATLTADGNEEPRYTVAASPKDTASVAVADDDAATAVTLSIEDEQVREGDIFTFQVDLSAPAPHEVRVSWHTEAGTAKFGHDFDLASGALTFRPGVLRQTITIFTIDDLIDEDPETFEVVLSNAQGATIERGTATGTIVNSDPMPTAWLSRFGRTVAQQTLDGIAGRLTAPRTPGAHGTIAGQAFSFAPASGNNANGDTAAAQDAGTPAMTRQGALALAGVARVFGGTANGSEADGFGAAGVAADRDPSAWGTGAGTQAIPLTAREALLGSRFTATARPDGTGGSLAFWGRAAQANFNGRDGTFSLDGEATTGLLGADYARDTWLVGVTLLRTQGRGGYRDTDVTPRPGTQTCPGQTGPVCRQAVRAGTGTIEASLTAAVPYAAWAASERLKLWGATGYGAGEVKLRTHTGQALATDIDWTMASAGLRGNLLPQPAKSATPAALALTSDALWARTTSDKTTDLAAGDSNVTRLRLGLEGSYRVALDDGGQFTPKLALGARHDGGDAETGFGVELGGGLAWSTPVLGLALDLEGRTLLTHAADDFEDQGFAASLVFDPAPATQRGPSVSLRQDWGGQATGGLDALFASNPLAQRAGSGNATSRWAAEAAWGFPAFGGRFTGSPHVGLGLATGTRDYSLGWRLTPAEHAPALACHLSCNLSFGLKATRRENDVAQPEHTIGFEVGAQW